VGGGGGGLREGEEGGAGICVSVYVREKEENREVFGRVVAGGEGAETQEQVRVCQKSETLTRTKSFWSASRGAQLVNERPPENSKHRCIMHIAACTEGRRVCGASTLGTSCKGSGISLLLKAVMKQKSGEVARPTRGCAGTVGGRKGGSSRGIIGRKTSTRTKGRARHLSLVLWPSWASQDERG
jgi:hypothetical protein